MEETALQSLLLESGCYSSPLHRDEERLASEVQDSSLEMGALSFTEQSSELRVLALDVIGWMDMVLGER